MAAAWVSGQLMRGSRTFTAVLTKAYRQYLKSIPKLIPGKKTPPEAVNVGSKGYKQVSTTSILAAAVNAIKELDEKVKAQNARKDKEIADLNARNKEFEERLKALEKMVLGPRAVYLDFR